MVDFSVVTSLKTDGSSRNPEDRAKIRSFLESLNVIKQLNSEVLEIMEIDAMYIFRTKETGLSGFVYRESDKIQPKIFIIISGCVKLSESQLVTLEVESTMPEIFVLQPGDVFGEEPVLQFNEKPMSNFRKSNVIQISEKLELLTFQSIVVFEALWREFEFSGLPLGLFFRPKQIISILSETALSRDLCAIRLLESALRSSPVFHSNELSEVYSKLARAAKVLLFDSSETIYKQEEEAETVYIILSGNVSLFWRDRSGLPSPKGVRFRSRAAAPERPSRNKPESHGQLAWQYGSGDTFGTHFESVGSTVEDGGANSAEATDAVPLARQRGFTARTTSQALLLALPLDSWERLHAKGAANLWRQIARLARAPTRPDATLRLLAALLRATSAFTTYSLSERIAVAGGLQYRYCHSHEFLCVQGQCSAEASSDSDAVGACSAYLVLSGKIATHAHRIRSSADPPKGLEAELAAAGPHARAELLVRTFGPALQTAHPGELVHMRIVGPSQPEAAVSCVALRPAHAARVPADLLNAAGREGPVPPRFARYAEILRIPPEERRDAELAELEGLLRGARVFEQFPPRCRLALCRALHLRELAAGEAVFRQGDAADEVYIVITGLLGLYVAAPRGTGRPLRSQSPRGRRGSVIGGDGGAAGGRRGSLVSGRRFSLSPERPLEGGRPRLAQAVRRVLGADGGGNEGPQCVGLRRAGDVIGDSLFTAAGARRAADLVAAAASGVAVLTRAQLADYRALIDGAVVRDLDAVRAVLRAPPALRGEDDVAALARYLSDSPFFRGQGEAFLTALARHAGLAAVEPGGVLFRAGEPADAFYQVRGAGQLGSSDRRVL